VSDKIDQPWLQKPSLQTLLSLLQEGGEEARVNGGAVRNAIMGMPVNDVDVSTTLVPRDVMLRAKAAGYKVVPTGIEHGTVTVVIDDDAFEVTTLRSDVETDGRHAKVLYGRDWEVDARRRDLTMNALYCDADGKVFDPLDGMPDVLSKTVRFIDDAETRIREDYLRILRFFRFFAWYGQFRPDAEGLKACARLKEELASLSVERIWMELSKLFAAPDPSRAILWMRQTGVLTAVLPESEKWGIDNMQPLMRMEQENNWAPDSLLRMMAILPPDPDKMKSLAARLKLPNKVRDRLVGWAETPKPDADWKQPEFEQWLYRQNIQGVEDTLRLSSIVTDAPAKKFLRQLKWLKRYVRPVFPIKGQDLLNQGVQAGPQVSEIMQKLESEWVESGFKLSREELLASID
jgi:tRNA nucleotidyltransferase/poly(A) polymerase